MLKSIKKLMAVMMSLSLLAGMLAIPVLADTASDVTTVGLEEVKVSDKYAYLRIQVLEDSIAVFSNPYDSSYYISSSTLLSALKSNNGYTLSYVNSVDGDDASTKHVTGGYIKAVKDGADTVYIPIVSKAHQVDTIQLGWSGRGWSETGTEGTSSRPSVQSIGGKPAPKSGEAGYDDSWTRGVVVSATGGTGNWLAKLQGNKDEANTNNVAGWIDNYDTTFTYVFNFFAENVAMPIVYANEVLVRFDSNGYLEYRSGGAGSETTQYIKTDYKITANRWHQLAITFCSGRWRPYIFLDGVNVVGSKLWYDWKVGEVAIGADKSVTGAVYFNDVRYYEGYYDPSAEIITAAPSAGNVKIDTKNKVIYYAGISELDALKSSIKEHCDASAVNVYETPASKTYTAATTLNNANNVVVLTSPNGLRYDYYTLAQMDMSDIVFNVSNGSIKASVAVFDSGVNASKLYIAAYDGTELMGIDVANVTADGTIADAQIAYNSSLTYKAFLWDASSNPVAKAEY
ncbi:MAG: hypothetical protein IKV73_02965 [Clostridia bacterium]|nr:hypothetical protein [Clostridia bacterium]